MGGERSCAGIAKTKLLAPSRREERERKEGMKNPELPGETKKKRKHFSSSQNLQVLYLQRQKKPQTTDNERNSKVSELY